MAEHPLRLYKKLEPKLLNLSNYTRDLALADGALPRKVTLLIGMVLDAPLEHPIASRRWLGKQSKPEQPKKRSARHCARLKYICGVG